MALPLKGGTGGRTGSFPESLAEVSALPPISDRAVLDLEKNIDKSPHVIQTKLFSSLLSPEVTAVLFCLPWSSQTILCAYAKHRYTPLSNRLKLSSHTLNNSLASCSELSGTPFRARPHISK